LKRSPLAIALFFILAALATAPRPAAAQGLRWSLLRAPGSSFTYGQDIDNAGTIVGFYGTDTAGVNFIKPNGGDFVPFSIPGFEDATFFSGINNSGTATGTVSTADFHSSAFIRKADGSVRILPGIGGVDIPLDTSANRITDNGVVVGNASAFDPVTFQTLVQRGVLIDTLHRDATTFVDYPGLTFTSLTGGNSHGTLCGWAASADFSTFIWFTTRSGKFQSFTFPAGSLFGNLFDVNDQGDVLGVYVSPDFVVHGFIQSANGKLTTLDYPGLADFIGSELPATIGDLTLVPSATLTLPSGFNDKGDLTGALGAGYADASGQVQFWLFANDGFVAARGSSIR
jgi:hypothetical protein